MNKKKVLSKINPIFLDGIAHRGLHNELLTENGLKAFENAINHSLAFEFDIHLTKDNELVVCHDENLKRTTGKEGIIEDLTLKEIKDNYHLLDGGDIPTLQEVIDFNHNRVPMVIELKVFRKNYKEIAKRFSDYIPQLVKRDTLIISFDPRCLTPLRKYHFVRSLLVAKSDEYTWPFRILVESGDLDKKLFTERRVKAYSKSHFTNAWTIETMEDLDSVLPYVDTVTFQHLDPKIVREKLRKKNGLI